MAVTLTDKVPAVGRSTPLNVRVPRLAPFFHKVIASVEEVPAKEPVTRIGSSSATLVIAPKGVEPA